MTQSLNRRVRCGILYAGPTPPVWATGLVRHLKLACGCSNVFELEVRRAADLLSFAPDFILNLSSTPLPPSVLQRPPFGAWAFRFGRLRLGDYEFGLGELWRGEMRQSVSLERITGDTNGRALFRKGWFKTILHSVRLHRESVIGQCETWPSLLAREIARKGKVPETSEASEPATQISASKKFLLSNVVLPFRRIVFFLSYFRRFFLHREWNFGYVETSAGAARIVDPQAIRWQTRRSRSVCYADPFLFSHLGKVHIAAERYHFGQARGSISIFSTDPDEEEHTVTLDFDFHASYPCMLNEGSEIYCIPETLEAGEIAVYRCRKFPRKWEKISVVCKGNRFSDPTLFKYENRWWVFGTLYDQYSDGNSTLHAWYADSLEGPWEAHLSNPIKCDVSGARSAGTPFFHEGLYLRPSQDCSRRYGGALVLQSIHRLTPEEFLETPFQRIENLPGYPDACHHLARFGNMMVVDGRRDTLSLVAGSLNFFRLARMIRPKLTQSWNRMTEPEVALEVFIKKSHSPFVRT